MQGKTKAGRAVAAGIIALGLCLAQPTGAFAASPTLEDANNREAGQRQGLGGQCRPHDIGN